MSGGHFDYDQFRISNIADSIQVEIDKNNIEENGYKREYSPEVIEEFKKAIKILKLASTYAHKIDYLISGDYGNESFLKALKKELEGIKND
jgi:hypothetical protein